MSGILGHTGAVYRMASMRRVGIIGQYGIRRGYRMLKCVPAFGCRVSHEKAWQQSSAIYKLA